MSELRVAEANKGMSPTIDRTCPTDNSPGAPLDALIAGKADALGEDRLQVPK
jgi:hypothetical protein